VSRYDILQNLTRNFARQPEKESALALIDRAVDLRRGTIKTVQQCVQPLQAREVAQEKPAFLRERLQAQRERRVLAVEMPDLVKRLRRHGESIMVFAQKSFAVVRQIVPRQHSRLRGDWDARYWRRVAGQGEQRPEGSAQPETQKQVRRQGLRF
jgi:hypothetical protein